MYLSSNKLLYSAFGLALTLQFSFPDQVLGMNEGSDEFSSASTPHPQSPPPSSETFLGMNDGDDGFPQPTSHNLLFHHQQDWRTVLKDQEKILKDH